MYQATLTQAILLSLWCLSANAQTFKVPSQELGTTWDLINPSVVGTGSKGTTLRFDQVAPPQGELTTTQTIHRTVLVDGDHYVESNQFFTLDCTVAPDNKGSYSCKDIVTVQTTVNGHATPTIRTDPITFAATTVVVGGAAATAPTASVTGSGSSTAQTDISTIPSQSQSSNNPSMTGSQTAPNNTAEPPKSPGGTAQLRVSLRDLSVVAFVVAIMSTI